MTQKTKSEVLFELFCTNLRLTCTPIPRSTGKTPDYELMLGGNSVIAEIKQLNPNEKDNKIRKYLKNDGVASCWSESGHRVRNKLSTRTNKQLKAYTNGQIPTILIV